MKNRFNLTEEEKNHIRGLHGIQLISESEEESYGDMDASNLDGDNLSDKEEDWMQEDWDDLDEDVQNAYREHEEFKGLDDSAIREKFNAMPLEALCKISRFLFGWIINIFKRPMSALTKELRGGMGGSGYKPRQAWRCKKRYKRW